MRRKKFIIVLALALFMTVGDLHEKLMAKETVYDVSIIQLISVPERFDGKYIRVIGFARLEFEGDAIYLHQEDYEYGLTKNGLCLALPEDYPEKHTESVDRKYVLVEGTFNAKHLGHMGAFSGAIENIKRLEVWNVKREVYQKMSK